MKTAEKIKALRIKNGFSQEQLGKMVGLQKAAINKYETGRVVNIKKSVLLKLAEALSVSPADLLDDPEYPSPEMQEEREMMDLLSRMNDDQKRDLIDYMKYLLSRRK